MPSFNASLICHIEWKPSRLLALALGGLGLLAALAVWLSAAPRLVAALAGVLCAVFGARRALMELRREAVGIIWPGGSEPLLMTHGDQQTVLRKVSLHLRGPMAVLVARDETGHRRVFDWYPDTLSAADRRMLRLAAARPANSRSNLPLLAS